MATLKEVLSKVALTKSHQVLFGIVLNIDPATKKPGTRLTMEQVKQRYDAKTKKVHKEGSITTLMSQMRAEFKDKGFDYPQSWDIARGVGGGRQSNRVSAIDTLSDVLGDGFDVDELEMDLEPTEGETTNS